MVLVMLLLAQHWPQAGGPAGTWSARGTAPPVEWSVATGKNIRWRTPLPNGGQSGIAVWGDRLFLTTFAAGEKGFSSRIVGLAVDARTGRILWQRAIDGPARGAVQSPMLYAFSDATSPTPVTDGKHVWFFNASGRIACFTWTGEPVWQHDYRPWGEPYPFNKQHEPILFQNLILNVEPLDGGAQPGWHYLRALDKQTGATRWIAEDATTAYNTARLGRRADGSVAVLHGRGGWHDVPERPVGLSLTNVMNGKTLWRFVAGDGQVQAPQWQALYVMHWDERQAYWFELGSDEKHLVLDAANGQLLREQSLWRKVDYRQWDPAQRKHIVHRDVNLREVRELAPPYQQAAGEVMRVLPVWHNNLVAGGYHYFLTTTGHRRNRLPPKGRAGPSHCVGRVNVTTGKVEYLELPVAVVGGVRVYGQAMKTRTVNAAGVDVAAEERSRTDGWEVAAFFGSPIAVNDRIYFTSMLGVTYVIDARAAVLDEAALLAVNDLGPAGETWSLNSVSYARGRLYHRSAKELVAIGK